MKATVSIPDELFHLAESTAKKLSLSRSQLYATAIAEFLQRAQSDAVTARIDEIYSKRRTGLDPALRRAQARSITDGSW